jgi:hypothetical protein
MRALLAAATLLVGGPVLAGVYSDFDGDQKSDLLWRNMTTGQNVVWPNAAGGSSFYLYTVPSQDWQVDGMGDFDADRRADLFWRNSTTGEIYIWFQASALLSARVNYDWGLDLTSNPDWGVAAIGDFDGDGLSDVLWRNRKSGETALGSPGANKSPSTFYVSYANPVTDLAWQVAGTGDVDGDGKAEIVWRNATTGDNVIWRITDINAIMPFSGAYIASVSLDWHIAGLGDFNGDGRSDILWHDWATGGNALWWSADSAAGKWLYSTAPNWVPAAIADIDGDLSSDIIWRNLQSGANYVWKGADAERGSYLPTVGNLSWRVVPDALCPSDAGCGAWDY